MSKPLGPGGVALLVVLAAALPVRCALLSDLSVIPNPFSPNGDGTYDQTVLSYTLSDSVWTVVAVEDTAGGTVRELWSGFQNAGDYGFAWDGRGTGGTVVDDGVYTFAATADEERRTLSVVLDTRAPEITGLSVTPSRFTPDGDGVSDSLFVRFVVSGAESGDLVTVDVLDDSESLVESLFQSTNAGSVSVTWDGMSGGETVADTTYSISVETLDAAGNGAMEGGIIDVDTDPPSIGSSAPDTTGIVATDTTTVTLTGWVYDRAGVDSLQYTADDSTWTRVSLVEHGSVPGAFTWSFDVSCPACTLDVAEESVGIRLRAYDGTLTADGKGHVNTDSSTPAPLEFDVYFDVAVPVLSSSSVTDDDSVYEPGETVTIETIWDQGGYNIDAFFYQIDSEFDEEGVTVSDFGNGSYEVTYTVSASNTYVPVGPERVRIVASDYFHSVADSSVLVSVEDTPASSSGFSVDRNSFDPGEGETVTVDPGDSSGAVEVDIYSISGALIVSLSAEAGSAVTWDGTNADGETVASGVYFLLTRVDGDEIVRKVAVVK
ncbi:MAG: hypothetical protein GF405_08305 [Candidatus Eisenbacteria bacterium]|nr:hypothetical protein [Candidatus Eisenbacteria bacterium]